MSEIPSEVLSQHLRALLSGRRVTAAVFMTYTLEPAFFEEEIVTLLATDALIQEPRIRLLQLEEALRGQIGPIAVYYDHKGLRPDGGKKLDIRYVPVRAKTGAFHPKLVLLLTEPIDSHGKTAATLVCGVLSANLTKAGWWSSVEGAHFEEIVAGERCSFKDDLRAFLRQVRRFGGHEADHASLDLIDRWLRAETEQTSQRTIAGRLRPQLIAGTGSLIESMAERRGGELSGCSLEVISPFIDENEPTALSVMLTKFAIRETRVFLPTAADGTANVNPTLYEGVKALKKCSWARLPEELLKLGREKNAPPRGVHAKVYRFFKRTKGYEALLVGSHNLSMPAHQNGGNVEASFLIEREKPGRIDWWLGASSKRPTNFAIDLGDEETNAEAFVPLQVSYDWAKKRVEVLWNGREQSGLLRVLCNGAPVFSCEALPSGEWTAIGHAEAVALEKVLVSTTVLEAVTADECKGFILVQEFGMSRKPSLVVSWSIADVLEYWSRLTPEQKDKFYQEMGGNVPEGLTEALERAMKLEHVESFFSTYAGLFHSFEMLRKQALASVAEGHESQADYLLLGKRHDSLPVLIDRVIAQEDEAERLSSYLLLLSARQLIRELRGRPEQFFVDRRDELKKLQERTKHADVLSQALDLGADAPDFVTWFEGHFLKNLRKDEEVASV